MSPFSCLAGLPCRLQAQRHICVCSGASWRGGQGQHLSASQTQLPWQSHSLPQASHSRVCTFRQYNSTAALGHSLRRPHRRLRPARAASREEEPDNEPSSSSDEATLLLNALQQQQRIGSEYGEGFIQLKVSGEAMHLDVDTLNERLKLKGAERMRTAMRPDEAFGMIFSWDGVIADMRKIQRRAWRSVAEREGLAFPTVERQLFGIRPERAVMDVLQWTRDWGTAQRLSYEFAQAVAAEFEALKEPMMGVVDWLVALKSVNVPCAVVTQLDRNSLNAALERMGLRHFFAAQVTAEDGMETTSQRFLSAAIKLSRPPKDCVVFESSPLGVTAAHNCSCKAVAVQGAVHPGYQLKQADLTCSSLSELSVYNIRRLFANRGADFMDKKKAFISSKGNSGNSWHSRIASGVADP